jgi:hypothetical protein
MRGGFTGTYHGANGHIGAENLPVVLRTLRRLKEARTITAEPFLTLA